MKTGQVFDKWGGRFSNVLTAWQILVPASLAGFITAYLAKGLLWLDKFGAFGWWAAGLIGFAVSTGALFCASGARLWWMHGTAVREWRRRVDRVNPVDKEFTKVRINILDLANPVTNIIEGKRFIDCEILGPATLLMLGNGGFSHVTFQNVDFIPCRDSVRLFNVIVLVNCTFIGGTITRATVFLPADMYKLVSDFTDYFPTLTGNPEIDKRLPAL